MQMFNGLTMGIFKEFGVNFTEPESSGSTENAGSAETYRNSSNEQLQKIKKEIDELTDTGNDGSLNTANDIMEIQGLLTTEFANYLKANPEIAKQLQDAVNGIPEQTDNTNIQAIQNLKSFLASITGKSLTIDTNNLSGITTPTAETQGKFYNNVNESREGESQINKMKRKVSELLSNNYAEIWGTEEGTKIKTALEKGLIVLGNPVEANVKILQKEIYNSLNNNDKIIFFSKNRDKTKDDNTMENPEFDGKFGTSTLDYANKCLVAIEERLNALKATQDVINSNETDNTLNNITSKPNVKKGETNPKALLDNIPDNADVKFFSDTEKEKLNTPGNNIKIKVKVTLNGTTRDIKATVNVEEEPTDNDNTEYEPTETKPLDFKADGKTQHQYLMMHNTQSLAQNIGLAGATFYSATPFEGNQPNENGEWQVHEAPADGDYECLMKMGDNIYKVKVDQNGNLCPTAQNFKSNIPVFFEYNTSCIKYIENKLPNALKNNGIKIGWNGKDYTISLSEGGKNLTIEPMTIDGYRLGENGKNNGATLEESLAFLNLTNYLRNKKGMDNKDFKNNNPNLKLEDGILKVRVNKRENNPKINGGYKNQGKRYTIDRTSFGLTSKNEILEKFIKYNNGEDWEDNWDKKKPNKYYKPVKLQ